MKDFLFGFGLILFFTESFVFSVYIRGDLPSTKPPLQVEELPWLSFFDRKPTSDDFARRSQIQRKNADLVSHSTLCPPGETGQFPYAPDCKRFINCWKGRGSIQVCAPGTLFNSETLECDFPGKVKCEENFDSLPMPAGERYVRFPHERPQIMHNPRIARTNQNEQTKPDSIPAKPYPGRPPYFGASHLQPPVRPSNQTQGREVRPQCLIGATGLYPHPYDCSKFLKCWSGNTFIQNCGPGTFFNPLISACDHPRNVPCAHDSNYQTVQPDNDEVPVEDYHVPEESVQYEQYQNLKPSVIPLSVKGGKKTIKHDPDSPNYDIDLLIGSSTPKSEVEDLETFVKSQTEAMHRKPKIINEDGSQNQYTKIHEREPTSYLTPPQYDVYGNVIGLNNTKQANLSVQPDQSSYKNNPKVQAQNPSTYPSSPFLINYPPQGPYSTLQPESQKKVSPSEQTKNYYGYMLNKKSHPVHSQHPGHSQPPGHSHRPVHPAHPHHPHSGPPTWLVPPPFQPQFFPHYAPYHPFFPQTNINAPQPSLNPYYPQYTQDGNVCNTGKSDKQNPTAPKCEPGTSFYEPSTFSQPPQKLPSQPKYPQESDNIQSQFHSNPSGHPTAVKPSSGNHFEPDHTPQVQINLSPKHPTTAFHSPDAANNYNPSVINSQYPKQKENSNPHQPESSSFPSGTSNQNNLLYSGYSQKPNSIDLTKQSSQKNPQYQPYLFYYYPFNSNLYPFNTNGFYPYQNFPNNPNHFQVPQNTQNQFQTSSNTPNRPQSQPNTPSHPQNQPYYPSYPQNQPNTPTHPQNQPYNPSYPQNQPNSPTHPQNQPYNPSYPQNQPNTPTHPQNQPYNPSYPQNQPNTPTHSQNQLYNPSYPQNQPNTPTHPQNQPYNPNYPQNQPNTPTHPQNQPNVHTNTPNHPQILPNNPNYPQTPPNTPTYSYPYPSYPQQPQTDSHPGQSTKPDPFSTVAPQHKPGRPDVINQGSFGPVEVSDPLDNKNHHPYPDSYPSGGENNFLNKPNPSGGQVEVPYPFDNEDKTNDDENYGTPYYPAYRPKERPVYSSDLISTEQPVKGTATFPPFPGITEQPHSGNIKTKVKPKNEYILGKIDVRTETEDEESEDAENITTTQPSVQKRKSEKEHQTIVKPLYIQPDKYTESNTPKESTQPKPEIKKPYVKVKPTPPNGQIVRLRNGASHLDGYLEMKDAKSKWGLVCDRSGQWGIAEATVACRELGFIRGAELSWQGYPIKSDLEELHVAVNAINCTGKETSLSECEVIHEDGHQCDIGRNAVGLRCFDNLASHCQPGEILYNQHCYKLHGKENPDDPWIKTEEASDECKKFGGKLVDITTQYENDFLSEWLIKKHPDVTAVATGGIGISVLGRPMWIWEGTNDPMVYERWWSGWSGDQPVPKGSINGPLCIVLRKTFSCADEDDVQKKEEQTKDEETCSADYFFWDVEDCEQLRTSVFICERPMDDIGCVIGNGEGYVGTANTTASGRPCLPWDHPKVVEGLARRGTQQERSSKLVGHNYCRNLGNPDRHPWCFVEGRGNSEYCAIPQCWDLVSGSYSRFSGTWTSCDANHFECKPGECIKKNWLCDGQKDCANGRDEENCKVFIQEFTTERNKRMKGRGNEKWPNVSENICANLCLENKNFRCKSFSYNFKDKDCLLSDTNIGLSGQVVTGKGWVYHERLSDSLNCTFESGFFGCQNGKCINVSNVCDGKKNCEDGSDERHCERLGYQIRLAGSKENHKGRIEIKILGKWGVVCDDKFDMRDAEVVCRELGFKLGAAEIFKHSEFPVENPLFLVDHLECLGNETTIRECSFPGWGKHNCGPEEVVGISCRVPGIECPEGHWQCKKSKECISLAYLCDELKDCDDGTDEDKTMCGSQTQIRLVGGPNATSGRLEIRRYDIWGTVCHDDFSPEAGHSVCRLLGFNGPSIVKKSAFFGPGKGPIWLDSGLCFVNESDFDECTKHMRFQNNCKHDEDVSLICSQTEFNQKSAATKPIAASSVDDDGVISEEKLRQVLISECSGKPKTKSRVVQYKHEKVVGGNDVAREALPWQASVRVRSGSGKSVHWCGAIVISPYHVLTAGHCLRDYNKAAYFIRVGDHDTKVPDPHEQEFRIEHLYMHPNFSKKINLNNDIGLVKIKGEIPLGEHIKPACLPPSVEIYQPGTNCSVSGWGSVAASATGFARTLRRAFIPILEPSICRAPFVYGDSLSEGMFCAGHLDGGVDSCQGDSGGPLMCQHEGREYLFGITSWGHGCGRPNKPGVYTNVAFYTDWIQQKIQSSLS